PFLFPMSTLSILHYPVFLTVVAVSFFSYTPQAFGASFDVYIDKAAASGGDGRERSPFQTIKEGLKKALANDKDERKISIKSGTYGESIILEKGMALEGAGRGKTIITGIIFVKDDAEIKKLTVRTGARTAITVEGKADFTLDDVEVRGFQRIGLDALPGKGTIAITDSAIHDSGGKGVYIQKDRRIEILDSRFYNNAEEGIDLRNNIDGFITNNAVYENGEGGMEIIVGDSDVKISKNRFTKNKASGIATQFYAIADDDGKIRILENKISNNGKYGIDCNVPSGGRPGVEYWSRSLELKDNEIEKNKREEINEFCRIIEAVDPDEERDNIIKETSPDPGAVSATPGELVTAELTEEDLAKEVEIWDQVEGLAQRDDERKKRIDETIQKVEKRNFITRFFLGVKPSELAIVKEEIRSTKENVAALKTLLEQAKNVQSDSSIQDFINEQDAEIGRWENFVAEQEKRWSLFGWIKSIF
ncbi:MAG: pectinesterase family protein, partial [bacterium]|nr:pectinesterase family protein [bacterium]